MEFSTAHAAGDRWQAFMDAASDRVQLVAREAVEGEDKECASSILQTPLSWTLWEREFGAALRPVAACRTVAQQGRALRRAGFGWVHRAAPFRYLRNHGVRGKRRRQLVEALHGPYAHYDLALVAEHERYQRSVCNSFCARYLGRFLLDDRLFVESMRRYQALYAGFFRAYAQSICGEDASLVAESRRLLPMMKHELALVRVAILDFPKHAEWLRRETIMRAPHGDTRRLPRVDLNLI